MTTFRDLTPIQRKTYLLVRTYEEERRKVQKGYKAFGEFTHEVLLLPVWKQFHTVTEWLTQRGWTLTKKEVHWQGYVKYAFTRFAPQIPYPGQLRNDRLLSDYIKHIPELRQKPKRSDEELRELYKKILHPDIASLPYILKRLHLDPENK